MSGKIPRAFFEIEHSRDIYNSLLKFLEIHDFRIDSFIVADGARHSESADRVASTAFKPIRAGIKFYDYEMISAMHTKLAEAGLGRGLFQL